MREKIRTILLIIPSAISVGMAIRFWRSVLERRAPIMIVDYSGPIYFMLGLLSSTISFQMALDNRAALPLPSRMALTVIDGCCFTSYFAVIIYICWPSFAGLLLR